MLEWYRIFQIMLDASAEIASSAFSQHDESMFQLVLLDSVQSSGLFEGDRICWEHPSIEIMVAHYLYPSISCQAYKILGHICHIQYIQCRAYMFT